MDEEKCVLCGVSNKKPTWVVVVGRFVVDLSAVQKFGERDQSSCVNVELLLDLSVGGKVLQKKKLLILKS